MYIVAREIARWYSKLADPSNNFGINHSFDQVREEEIERCLCVLRSKRLEESLTELRPKLFVVASPRTPTFFRTK